MAIEARRRGRRPDPSRRVALVRAAKRVFFEKGFEGASVREIAEQTGIQSGSVYHHVASKEELLFEIVQDVYVRSLELLDETVARDGDPLAKLEHLMRGHVLNVTVDAIATTLALGEYKSLSAEHAGVISRAHRAYLSGFTELIREGQALGLVKPELDPELAMRAIVGCLNSIVPWYRRGTSESPDRIADHFVGVLLSGLVAA